MMQLAGRAVHRPTALQLVSQLGVVGEVTGQYLFQRGHLYYPMDQKGEAKLVAPGPGIQTSAVVKTDVGATAITWNRPDDEEMQLL